MSPSLRLISLLGLAAGSFAPSPGQAPAPPETGGAGIMLDPFPVVGTRLDLSGVERSSPEIVRIDAAFIARSGAVDLPGLLQVLPQTYGGSASGLGTVPNGTPSYGNATALFSFATGAAAPLSQSGVASAGLGAFGASGTLVLIDGRRLPLATQEDTASLTGSGFYDLASIPLNLIERVEVLTNGASAVHGSEAVGGVINVILRRNHQGGELIAGLRGTEEGGAFERHATLSWGHTRAPLSLFLSATTRSREALPASRRDFSASQDLTPLGGRDHRLFVGSPPIVSARTGTLNGVSLPNGAPARVALVPAHQSGVGLAPADFGGVPGSSGAFQRYHDSANERDLVGASRQVGLLGSATYALGPHLEAFASVNWSDRSSLTRNEPPAVAGGGFGGTQVIIPASHPLNPFSQDLFFSGVLVEAPARPQTVDVGLMTATAGLRGTVGEHWRWEAAAHHARESFDSHSLELNAAAFASALSDGSYNPFGDPVTHGPLNAHLNQRLMRTVRVAGWSRVSGVDAFARGPIGHLPAGAVLLAAGAEALRAERRRASTHPVFGQPAEIHSARSSTAAFVELFAPLLGDHRHLPLLHHLSLRTAARHERAATFAATTPMVALQWQPWPDLTVFAHHAGGFRAPALTEIEDTVVTGTTTITDPLQDGSRYSVTYRRGGNPDLDAERSRTYQAGLVLAPRAVSGFQLHAHLSETYWTSKLNSLPEQTLVNHEARFPARVVRDAAGLIATVDATTINFGEVYSRALDLGTSHRFAFDHLGELSVSASAVRQLVYRVESRPDRTGEVTRNGVDTASPPRWKSLASLVWSRGSWDVSVLVTHLAGHASNQNGPFFDRTTTTPSWTTVDLRLGLTFAEGLWRGRGGNARLQLGVGNIANRQPPFANTAYGYNQSLHSPLGRTYDLSLKIPF